MGRSRSPGADALDDGALGQGGTQNVIAAAGSDFGVWTLPQPGRKLALVPEGATRLGLMHFSIGSL